MVATGLEPIGPVGAAKGFGVTVSGSTGPEAGGVGGVGAAGSLAGVGSATGAGVTSGAGIGVGCSGGGVGCAPGCV